MQAETSTPTFVPVYKDARTGFFKVAHFARTQDRYWGSLKFVGEDWTLQRRTVDGPPVDVKSGTTPGRSGYPQIQRTLDGINGPQAMPNGSKKKKA